MSTTPKQIRRGRFAHRLLLGLSFLIVLAWPCCAETLVSGTLSSNATWTAAGSPFHVTGTFTVASGVTLTITPGVTVTFDSGTYLTVNGTLLAEGTDSLPIVFTSSKATPQAGDWSGIYFIGTESAPITGSVLRHATVAYAGAVLDGADVLVRHAGVTIENCNILASKYYGIYADTGGGATIASTHFADNGLYAIRTRSAVDLALSGLSASGNGHDAVALYTSALQGDPRLELCGLEYHVLWTLQIAAGRTLTIDPGVTIRFATGCSLEVSGRVLAEGTVGRPIALTGMTAAPGAWNGLWLDGTDQDPAAGSLLTYVNLAYGGAFTSSGIIWLTNNATLCMRHCNVGVSAHYGVRLDDDARLDAAFCFFQSNADAAILNSSTADAVLADLTASGNGRDGVELSLGTLTGDHTWTNPGIPYHHTFNTSVEAGGSLTIQEGTTVLFDATRLNFSNSRLICPGTADRPIVLSAANGTAGGWGGLLISGNASQINQGSVLRHTTIEYGGSTTAGGNIELRYARALLSDCIVRYSQRDGIHAYRGHGSVVTRCSITGNLEKGLYASGEGLILAAQNWWGAASGPYHAATNPTGTGQEAYGSIAIRPWLQSADEDPGPISTADVQRCGLEPNRWFAPANGSARIWFTLTVRDAQGEPLANQSVSLSADRGTVVDGGLTDLLGQTHAYVTSTAAGDSAVTAAVVTPEGEYALMPEVTVTFTDPAEDWGLFPDAESPYMNGALGFSPLPITQDVPTVLSARMVNPNTFDILVDMEFAVYQFGIGQAFGPVGTVTGHRIAANSESSIETTWVPSASGHQCIRVIASYSPASSSSPGLMEIVKGNEWLFNKNITPPTMGQSNKAEILDKAEKATGYISKMAPGKVSGGVAKTPAMYHVKWILDKGRAIDAAMKGEPPRLDYDSFDVPARPQIPPAESGDGISVERAQAVTAFMEAMADVIYFGHALLVSYDRFGGASNADDLYWASQQNAAMLYYNRKIGGAWRIASRELRDLLDVLDAEHEPDIVLTLADIEAEQQRLAAGIPAEERAAAVTCGFTESEIDDSIAAAVAADPRDQTGSLFEWFAQLADVFEELADTLEGQENFAAQAAEQSGAVRLAESGAANFVDIGEAVHEIPVRNPLDTATSVTMRVRPLNMSPDWMVTVTPDSFDLASGETRTVTVRTVPGLPPRQGDQPALALEAWARNEDLIGGVVLQLMVPEFASFSNPAGNWTRYQ